MHAFSAYITAPSYKLAEPHCHTLGARTLNTYVHTLQTKRQKATAEQTRGGEEGKEGGLWRIRYAQH